MSTVRASDDEPFFAEWEARAPGARRSLDRARRVYAALGIAHRPPILGVVGSKGKGVTALSAEAALRAAGLRVVTACSPALLENRERLRLDGATIPSTRYATLGTAIAHARRAVPASGEGYLSPSGTYLGAAMQLAHEEGADAVVLEAGMGGASDELSLFTPDVVILTAVFAEHLGVLGNSLEEIAREKAGVVTEARQSLVLGRLDANIAALVEQHVREVGARVVADAEMPALAIEPLRELTPFWENVALGARTGMHLSARIRPTPVSEAAVLEALTHTEFRGRGSVHVGNDGRRWLLDAAISGEGVRRSLEWSRRRLRAGFRILVAIPDGKDAEGVAGALATEPRVSWCRVEEATLTFDESRRAIGRPLLPTVDEAVAALGDDDILAIGTWSFLSAVARRAQLTESPSTALVGGALHQRGR